jgi:hypothetical protein
MEVRILPLIIIMAKKMLNSPFLPMGKMKREKRFSNRLELDGMVEGMANREIGQQVESYFIAVKNDCCSFFIFRTFFR